MKVGIAAATTQVSCHSRIVSCHEVCTHLLHVRVPYSQVTATNDIDDDDDDDDWFSPKGAPSGAEQGIMKPTKSMPVMKTNQ